MTKEFSADDPQNMISKLTKPGIIGFYTRLEVTEIIGFPLKRGAPVNIFTLIVAEDSDEHPNETAVRLNPNRIKIKSLPEWSFGIYRYEKPIDCIDIIMKDLCDRNQWLLSGENLSIGTVSLQPCQFVPPDSISSVPWNAVLKNNFWNGLYVFEWADSEKALLRPLFDMPRRLQELSESIQQFVPIRAASLSDRLGNVVLQLPSTLVISKFIRYQAEGEWAVQLAWHPKAVPRPLRASCEIEFDNITSGYASFEITDDLTPFPMPSKHGVHNGIIWDDDNKVVLAATGPSAFINVLGLNMHIGDPEPRTFQRTGPDGVLKEYRVKLHSTQNSQVGEMPSDANGGWTRRRMYKEEATRLAAERRFVQYKPKAGQQKQEHEKALNDLRALLNTHAENGAWLWDPYLSAEDILDTLFHCSHFGVDLRALTAALIPTDEKPELKETFSEKQKRTFSAAQTNRRGLNLEYRAKIGPAGWGFHDRFLIFPGGEKGALAWSLGTSINSLGKQHHILQRVDDGQLVMDAFVELWDQLDRPEHLIWKTP